MPFISKDILKALPAHQRIVPGVIAPLNDSIDLAGTLDGGLSIFIDAGVRGDVVVWRSLPRLRYAGAPGEPQHVYTDYWSTWVNSKLSESALANPLMLMGLLYVRGALDVPVAALNPIVIGEERDEYFGYWGRNGRKKWALYLVSIHNRHEALQRLVCSAQMLISLALPRGRDARAEP